MAGRQPERGAAGRARVGGELAEELPAAVGAADAQEQWERLLALERRLCVAVELETYELAAKLRDGQAALCGEAPLRQRYILALVRKLRSASSTREELMEAVSELGEHGHSYDAVPELAAALHSAVGAGDKALTEAIIDAMWAIFTHSPNPAVTAKMKTGMDLMAAGSIPEAAEVFTEVIELEPSFAEGKREAHRWRFSRTRRVVSYHAPSCFSVMRLNAKLCLDMLYQVRLCHAMIKFCHNMSFRIVPSMSCYFIPFSIMSCQCLVNVLLCHAMQCHLLSCQVTSCPHQQTYRNHSQVVQLGATDPACPRQFDPQATTSALWRFTSCKSQRRAWQTVGRCCSANRTTLARSPGWGCACTRWATCPRRWTPLTAPPACTPVFPASAPWRSRSARTWRAKPEVSNINVEGGHDLHSNKKIICYIYTRTKPGDLFQNLHASKLQYSSLLYLTR